jgi:hypothetical protein
MLRGTAAERPQITHSSTHIMAAVHLVVPCLACDTWEFSGLVLFKLWSLSLRLFKCQLKCGGRKCFRVVSSSNFIQIDDTDICTYIVAYIPKADYFYETENKTISTASVSQNINFTTCNDKGGKNVIHTLLWSLGNRTWARFLYMSVSVREFEWQQVQDWTKKNPTKFSMNTKLGK